MLFLLQSYPEDVLQCGYLFHHVGGDLVAEIKHRHRVVALGLVCHGLDVDADDGKSTGNGVHHAGHVAVEHHQAVVVDAGHMDLGEVHAETN